ncbi:MAG: patatin-like phospholipase family protein [bacterium]
MTPEGEKPDATRKHASLGRRDRGPFVPGDDDGALKELGIDRVTYADALREELLAVIQRRARAKQILVAIQKKELNDRNAARRHVEEKNELLARKAEATATESAVDNVRRSSAQAIVTDAAQEAQAESPLGTGLMNVARTSKAVPAAIGHALRKWKRNAPRVEQCTTEEAPDKATESSTRSSLAGLALSGGGIRSATFALGALQALAESEALPAFDYFSTVSGGGFTGGWWSAWLSRAERKDSDGFFPADERLEPDRYPAALLHDAPRPTDGTPPEPAVERVPDGSRSVLQNDPIHHLRLFSNYLTPRTGLLSGDSWRNVTIISRNMLLTWLVLIPVLLAVVMVGQLYFAGRHDVGYSFACSLPDTVVGTVVKGRDTLPVRANRSAASDLCVKGLASAHAVARSWRRDSSIADRELYSAARLTVVASRLSHAEVLEQRLLVLTAPLISAVIMLVLFTLLWMLYSSQTLMWTAVNFAGVVVLILALFNPRGIADTSFLGLRFAEFRHTRWLWFTVLASSAAILAFGFMPWLRELWHTAEAVANGIPRDLKIPRDQVRNGIVRWHARALMAFTLILAGLFLAGFGHEVVWYFFDAQSGVVSEGIRKAGGSLAFLAVVASAVISVAKAFPSPKAHDAAAQPPGVVPRFAMAVAPVLTILALTIACAWFGHWIMGTRTEWSPNGYPEDGAAAWALLMAVSILFSFAVVESISRRGTLNSWREVRLRTALGVGVLVVVLVLLALTERRRDSDSSMVISFPMLSLSVAVFMLRVSSVVDTRGRRFASIATGLAGAILTHWWLTAFLVTNPDATSSTAMFSFGLYALAAITLLLLMDWILHDRVSQRSTMLSALAMGGSFALVLLHHMPHQLPGTALQTTAIGWAGFLVAWVVGLGWTIDPNLMSLHNFYKARIVRAYLGASNIEKRRDREISEAAPKDDILLRDLTNHCQGAPLHLLNATLNLVGGRDLATAQRSAAQFTMSSKVCGSARTGYRSTAEYMDGTLTLGTAVAVSGAAVSPTMGAKSVNSSLALLLALFNVRLGFWAPTPNRSRWKERQPTLWPLYLLNEALSQTNDLGPYCYLTDGGHFDNTGVYALVERGCRYIYVLDDGADPKPCFSDMGDLIRRVRIDFGAEIDLVDGMEAFAKDEKSELANAHAVQGTIRYKPAHLRMLGWSELDILTKNRGHILWVKPAVTKADSVDVQQYHLENAAFPQQTTTDQWYDEAQFESYRALGYQSTTFWLNGLPAAAGRTSFEAPELFL